MSSFTQFLNESKEQLDISVLAANKWLKNESRKEYFLTTPCKIEAKTDGVKLTILKIDNTGDYTKDYIFSYKGNILYTSEFDYISKYRVKKYSMGASQFKLVFDHFSKLPKNNIPVNTELFIEYLLKKSTLSSNYKRPHGMVLIASAKSSYKVEFGKLKTKPDKFDTSKRNDYAKQLKLNVPLKIFEGTMISEKTFEKGIKNPQLKKIFLQDKSAIDWNNYDSIISNISQMLLQVESAFGGVEEGVVIKFPDILLKIQQAYQVDQKARLAIKNKYRDTPENETIYWNNVKLAALEIQKMMSNKKHTLEDKLAELSQILKTYKPTFTHIKKNTTQIIDDIQITAKTQIIKGLKGNNNSLILGRFQPLTLGHQKMIKRASYLTDKIVICIIGSKTVSEKNPFSLELREKMIRDVFPEAYIITHSTGNLLSILRKSPININFVWAGSDRIDSYRKQLQRADGVYVKEIPRTNVDISATKVREAIKNNDFKSFKSMVDKKLWKYWDILKEEIQKGEDNG